MFGGGRNEVIEYASYNCNGTLALQLFSKIDKDEEEFYSRGRDAAHLDLYQIPYGVVTVNLPESEMLKANVQFVD